MPGLPLEIVKQKLKPCSLHIFGDVAAVKIEIKNATSGCRKTSRVFSQKKNKKGR